MECETNRQYYQTANQMYDVYKDGSPIMTNVQQNWIQWQSTQGPALYYVVQVDNPTDLSNSINCLPTALSDPSM
jgi:hypothetical protein